MEAKMEMIEREVSEVMSTYCHGSLKIPGTNFTSAIKFYGSPILPPVMTADRLEEMKLYRRQAVITETSIRARQRQKLLKHVQSVIMAIDERHTPSPGLTAMDFDKIHQAATSTVASSADNEAWPQQPSHNKKLTEPPEQVCDSIVTTSKTMPTAAAASDVMDCEVTKINPDSGFSSHADFTTKDDGTLKSPEKTTDTMAEETTDTMAEITDLSSGTETEDDEERNGNGHPTSRRSENNHNVSPHQHLTLMNIHDQNDGITSSYGANSNFDLHSHEEVAICASKNSVAEVSPQLYNPQQSCTESVMCESGVSKSTSSSHTTMSNDGSDMNRTVISKEDADSLCHAGQGLDEVADEEDGNHVLTLIDGPEHTDVASSYTQTPVETTVPACQPAWELPDAMSTQSSLLSRVDLTLDDGTPDTAPSSPAAMTESDSDREIVSKQKYSISRRDMKKSPLVNKDEIGVVEEVRLLSGGGVRAAVERCRERTVSGGGLSSASSGAEEASHFYTTSTELAPYMIPGLVDTLHSATTVPHLNDTLASQDQSLRTEVADMDSSYENEEATSLSRDPGATPGAAPGRIRNDSYTLDHPSPALIQAESHPVQEVSTLSTPSKRTQQVNEAHLTNSMEDLRLRPAQRNLCFENKSQTESVTLTNPSQDAERNAMAPSSVSPGSSARHRYYTEKEGKDEHLHRYLEHLSEMPSSPKPQLQQPDTSISSGTELNDSLGSGVDPSFAVALQSTPFDGEAMGQLSEEELLNLQAGYFDRLRRQLIEQQQQQLGQMLAEQEAQQLLLQQDLLNYKSVPPVKSAPPVTSTIAAKSRSGRNNRAAAASIARKQTSQTARHPGHPLQLAHEDIRPVSAPVPPHTTRRSTSGHNTSGYSLATSLMDYKHNQQPVSPVVIKSRPNTDTLHSVSPHTAMFSPKHNVRHSTETRARRVQPAICIREVPPAYQKKFDKLSALIKGHLTRRLFHSARVQHIINTIQDTAEFALHFQQETQIKKGQYSLQDIQLQERVLAQLTAAMYEIHEIFFVLSKRDQMAILAHTRQLQREKFLREQGVTDLPEGRHISAATLKARERKKRAQLAESSMMAEMRPKSAPPPQSSSHHQLAAPSARHDPLGIGAVQRNYRFLMSRALQPTPAQKSPNKPVKDNMNRVTAMKDKQYRSGKPSAVVKPLSSTRPSSSTRPKSAVQQTGKLTRKTARPEPSSLVPHTHRKVARPATRTQASPPNL